MRILIITSLSALLLALARSDAFDAYRSTLLESDEYCVASLPFFNGPPADRPAGNGQRSMCVRPWTAAMSLAFAANAVAVSVPQRIDSRVDVGANGKPTYTTARKFKPVLQPAPWAFAIWGAIYLSEFVFLLLLLLGSSPISPEIAVPWIVAHLSQALWCFAFVPSLERNHLYLSAMLLGAVATSMSFTQVKALDAWDATFGEKSASFFELLTGSSSPQSSTRDVAIVAIGYFATTAHYAWATAATLVNANSYVGVSLIQQRKVMVMLAALSASFALALGFVHVALRRSCLYMLVVSWTLTALADAATGRLARYHGAMGVFACSGSIAGACLFAMRDGAASARDLVGPLAIVLPSLRLLRTCFRIIATPREDPAPATPPRANADASSSSSSSSSSSMTTPTKTTSSQHNRSSPTHSPNRTPNKALMVGALAAAAGSVIVRARRVIAKSR